MDYNSSDYDEFLYDAEATRTVALNYEIPLSPPGLIVTMHLDDKHNELKKIHNQKRGIRRRLVTEHRQ